MGEKSNHSFMHQAGIFVMRLSYIRLLLMIHLQILVGGLHNGQMTSSEFTNSFFTSKSRLKIVLKRATGMGVVSLNLAYHDASPDMQHDLFGSACDLRVSLT